MSYARRMLWGLIGLVPLWGQGSERETIPLNGDLAGELSFRSGEWAVDGPFTLALSSTPEPLTAVLSLRAAELPLPELDLSDLAVEAQIELLRSVAHVRSVEFAVLGGRVSLRPFDIDWSSASEALSLSATAELHGLSLERLAAFVPEAVHEASGRVSGQVHLSWSQEGGLQIGTGTLHIDVDSTAQLRLVAMPGFLTQHTSPRFVWMPASFGRLARWLSLDNPAYDTLAEIEEGTQPLRVETLHVVLYPDGPGGPRSAAVSLVAHPLSGAVVKRLRFDINVAGPLDQVLRLGASDTVRLNFGTQ